MRISEAAFTQQAATGLRTLDAGLPLRVGLDFDNTLVCYDGLFYTLAVQEGLVPASTAPHKAAVRAYLRTQSDGERVWQWLQRQVYGPAMAAATLFPGVVACLKTCHTLGIPLWIVSHKTRTGGPGFEQVRLREHAWAWMYAQDFFSPQGLGLDPAHVFFEESRSAKLERLTRLRLTHFVDDLEEVLCDALFPSQVQPLLFAPAFSGENPPSGLSVLKHWDDFTNRLHSASGNTESQPPEVEQNENFKEKTHSEPLPISESIFANLRRSSHTAALEETSRASRNSHIEPCLLPDHTPVMLKHYFRPPWDRRDRLATEVRALQLMALGAIPHVPRVLAWQRQPEQVLLTKLEGVRPSPEQLSRDDMKQAAIFLGQLQGLRSLPEALQLNTASDGGLCLQQNIDNLNRRLVRIQQEGMHAAEAPALRQFLSTRLEPAWAQVQAELLAFIAQSGRLPTTPLEPDEWVISPSDFGGHNWLRTPSGGLAFLDFEYLGWEDPVKLVVDVLHHPGHRLSPTLQAAFLSACRQHLPWSVSCSERLPLAWQLFGLNWCLILLNEFLPGALARRRFAGEQQSEAVLQRQQLEAATRQLEQALTLPSFLIEAS
ncbi:MAG: phosphotransferase [Myxococcota bacterium]